MPDQFLSRARTTSPIADCNLLAITTRLGVMAIALRARNPCPVPTLNPKKARKIMFGLVMVLTLVLITVAPPFLVVAKTKQKSRGR